MHWCQEDTALDRPFSPVPPAAFVFLTLRPSKNTTLSIMPHQSHHHTPLLMQRKFASIVLMACRFVGIVVKIISPGSISSDTYSMGIVQDVGRLRSPLHSPQLLYLPR